MKVVEKNLKAVANRRRLAIIKYLKENSEATATRADPYQQYQRRKEFRDA